MKKLNPFRRRRGCGCVTILFILCAAIAAVLAVDSNTRIVTQEYIVESESIPASFNGYRIVLLSDIHNKTFGGADGKLTEEVRKAKPNIIAVTGDLIDSDGQLESVLPLLQAFSEIAPVYFVTGNHEWATHDCAELLRRLPDYGVTVLENKYSTITIGSESITLVGFGDPNGHLDQPSPETVMSRLPDEAREGFVVGLYHRNHTDRLNPIAELGVDLILCGHAHGGTVRLPGIGGIWAHGFFPDLVKKGELTNGLYSLAGTSYTVVSRGIGNSHHIPRFMNNPHVAVAVLKSK